ncbi:hypothetical protein AKO1_011729 [Acrasis kona]|uniref:Maelstrom domain-containing protein n=1 Tax=Acrasis kona TaxID=1008807 RepID=A0AAW2Z7J6_9EUKA
MSTIMVENMDKKYNAQALRDFLALAGAKQTKVKVIYRNETSLGFAAVWLNTTNESLDEQIRKINTTLWDDKYVTARPHEDKDAKWFGKNAKPPRVIPPIPPRDEIDEVYFIDFEMAVSTSRDQIPLEIGIAKFSFKQNQTIDTYHTFIEPGRMPYGLHKTAEFSRANIHGIPYQEFSWARDDYVEIWNELTSFVTGPHPIMIAKDPKAENGCIEWLREAAQQKGEQFQKDAVMDIGDFLIQYQPTLTNEQIQSFNKIIGKSLDASDKCEYHKEEREWFHCAKEDACANAKAIQKLINQQYNI